MKHNQPSLCDVMGKMTANATDSSRFLCSALMYLCTIIPSYGSFIPQGGLCVFVHPYSKRSKFLLHIYVMGHYLLDLVLLSLYPCSCSARILLCLAREKSQNNKVGRFALGKNTPARAYKKISKLLHLRQKEYIPLYMKFSPNIFLAIHLVLTAY